jgi:hypothetical protein
MSSPFDSRIEAARKRLLDIDKVLARSEPGSIDHNQARCQFRFWTQELEWCMEQRDRKKVKV